MRSFVSKLCDSKPRCVCEWETVVEKVRWWVQSAVSCAPRHLIESSPPPAGQTNSTEHWLLENSFSYNFKTWSFNSNMHTFYPDKITFGQTAVSDKTQTRNLSPDKTPVYLKKNTPVPHRFSINIPYFQSWIFSTGILLTKRRCPFLSLWYGVVVGPRCLFGKHSQEEFEIRFAPGFAILNGRIPQNQSMKPNTNTHWRGLRISRSSRGRTALRARQLQNQHPPLRSCLTLRFTPHYSCFISPAGARPRIFKRKKPHQ